jgi:hypothetical protein
MKHRSFTIFLFMAFNLHSYAQRISGLVKDIQNKALVGATVRLNSDLDTSLKQMSMTNQNGAFVFNQLKNGSYSLTISHVGFQVYHFSQLKIDDTHTTVTLPVIILRASGSQTLKEVVITSKKPLIEQQTDRTIINVDAMISAAGGSALDALSKSPGVMVDANDNISLNGKSGVLVLIDDRPTYITGQDLADYLRSLPAGILDKLELLSNPPARYDASGGAVINIVLKKNRASGFNGSLNVGYNQGVYARSNNALNINYRTAKFNIFSNSSYALDQSFNDQTFSRYFYRNDGTINNSLSQNSHYTYRSDSWNGRVGMDYFLSPKTTLGLMLTGDTHPKTDLLNYATNQYNDRMQLDSFSIGSTGAVYHWQNTGINLNLQQKLNAGAQFSADLDYVHFSSDGNQYAPIYKYDFGGNPTGIEQRTFLTPALIDIYSGKADYTRLLGGKAELSAGIKSSFVSNDSQLDWFNSNLPDYGKTNRFRYTENINSAYVNFRKSWRRWGIQSGLRIENTIADGHQFSNPVIPDSAFTRHYTYLFPSLFISYKLDTPGNSTLVLSYNKRMRRPGYQQLNPFLFYRDPYTYSSGNPDLLPYFNHYIELKYTYKQYISVTAGYWIGNNQTTPVTIVSGDVFTTRSYNFLNNRTYSFIPYFSFDPTPWWTFHINAVLLYIINKGSAGGVTIDQLANVHEIETSNELRLSKTWSAELDGFFPGKQAFGQTQSDAVYNISGGIQKTIWQGNGTIHLTMNDILHTLVNHSQTIGVSQVSAFSTRRTDSRKVGVSFTYRFGKAANERKRNHNTGGAEDEKGRTN